MFLGYVSVTFDLLKRYNMKPFINSFSDAPSGTYVKADRSGKTSYPICINSNGNLYWIKTTDVKTVNNNGTEISASKFFNLLQIK